MLDPLSSMFDGIGTKCFTPCRRMVCPDLSRAVFYKYLFPFRFEKTASSESRELSPPSPSMFARTRAPHPARSWERQVWQALYPLTDQSNSRYRCQAQLPKITREAPGPPAARSTRVSSPSAISGLAFWVKSSECPHISQQSIQIDRQIWGEH